MHAYENNILRKYEKYNKEQGDIFILKTIRISTLVR